MKQCVFWSADTQNLKTTVVLERNEEISLGFQTFQAQTRCFSPPLLFLQLDRHHVRCSRSHLERVQCCSCLPGQRPCQQLPEEIRGLADPCLCQDPGVSTDPPQVQTREGPAPRGPLGGSWAPRRCHNATSPTCHNCRASSGLHSGTEMQKDREEQSEESMGVCRSGT